MTTYTSSSTRDHSISYTDGQGGPLLSLSVERDSTEPTISRDRITWHYVVKVTDDDGATSHEGRDLQSPAGDVDPKGALGSLVSFLSACVEGIEHEDRTGGDSENADLFPRGLIERFSDWETALHEIEERLGKCPECGALAVVAPGLLPVCGSCDWTGWAPVPS